MEPSEKAELFSNYLDTFDQESVSKLSQMEYSLIAHTHGAALDYKEAEVERLEAEVEKLTEDVGRLEEDNYHLDQDNEELQNANDHLEARIEEMKRETEVKELLLAEANKNAEQAVKALWSFSDQPIAKKALSDIGVWTGITKGPFECSDEECHLTEEDRRRGVSCKSLHCPKCLGEPTNIGVDAFSKKDAKVMWIEFTAPNDGWYQASGSEAVYLLKDETKSFRLGYFQ